MVAVIISWFELNTRTSLKTDTLFYFKNTQGWRKIEPRDGAGASYIRAMQNNTVQSYAEVRYIENHSVDEADLKNKLAKVCDDNVTAGKGKDKQFEKYVINKMTGYQCKYTTVSSRDASRILQINQYTFLNNDKKYLFLITTSFPFDNDVEENYEQMLVNSFQEKL